MKSFTLLSGILFTLGVAAWGLVGYLYAAVQDREVAYVERAAGIDLSIRQQMSAARINALVNDTKDAREALQATASTDLLSAVKLIEGAGEPMGLPVRILHVSPSAPAKKNPVRTVSFSLESEGAYDALLRLVRVFETLPLLISVDQVDLYQLQGGDSKANAKALWHLSMQVRFLTTSSAAL